MTQTSDPSSGYNPFPPGSPAHDAWILFVLEDLRAYARKRGLASVATVLSAAITDVERLI